MARVALCLSGQPRNYRDSFPYIYKNIIEPNNADVFFHTWFDKEDLYIEKFHMDRGKCKLMENTIEELVGLYKPKDFFFEKQREFKKPNLIVTNTRLNNCMELNKHKSWTIEQTRDHIIKQNVSMYYSIFKSIEIKENYANQHGIVYDYVIRMRFDCLPLLPLNCELYNPDILYFQDLGHTDNLVSDWFNFGSNLIINILSTTYLSFEYFNSSKYYNLDERLPNTLEPCSNAGAFAEYMLRDIMTLHKIPTQKINLKCILSNGS